MIKTQKYSVKKGLSVLVTMFFLMIIIILISINTGKMSLSPLEIIDVLLAKGTAQQNLIIFEFRLHRIILAALVGIGMSISGAVMQSLLRNDMASPGTLGISSGSGLFVLLYVIFFKSGSASPITLPLLAFIGGMTAALLIYLFSYRKNRDISPTELILNGVALGSGYGAITTLLTLKLDQNQMDFMQRWFAGSLWGDTWNYLSILIPWTIILSFYILYKSRVLDVIHLGNQTATGLGVAVKLEFVKISVAAIALSAGSVALGGSFFFIGMIAPHMAKKLVGPNHKLLLPAAGMAGASIVLFADVITKVISFGTNIPTGIIITVLSTPYFLYLLAKSN